jgi:hypothetical protein
MLWSVCNDADPDEHTNDAGYTDPLGLEVRQTTFAFDRQGALGNIIFVRYRVYNKGQNTIENCYLSLWNDPDLGEYTDDLVGCDTNLSLGYVYNSDDDDAGFYEDKPPCMGVDFFQGPLVEAGPNDTAYMWGDTIVGYKNLGMVSFNKYINGTDPNDFNETYNYMQGLSPNGDPYVYDGDTLLYMHSGDPVTDPDGDSTDVDFDPADRRWMQSTGPITFAPGDSTEIIAAIIVGLGGNRFESITVVKELDDFAQRIYENNFNPPSPAAKPKARATEWPGEIVLTWNDTSEVDPGDFAFEGYSVWQGESPTGDVNGEWTLLATFDLASTTEPALVDSVRHSESGLIIPWIRRSLTNQGLQYTYHVTRDRIEGGPLREQKPYYFRVTAFSFSFWQYFPTGDSARVPNADRLLESQTVMTIIPQAPPAGEHTAFDAMDTIPVTHVVGGSQGRVIPIVTEPRNLNGHTYMVVFEDDGAGGVVWDLIDSTTGEILLDDQTDQVGVPGNRVVDGMYINVLGAESGFLSFEVVANGDGPIDPPEAGAFPWPGFPVPTDVDPDGYPTEGQQVGEGLWGFHTADNGGSSGGGEWGGYSSFLERVLRGDNADRLAAFDYEMRFTGSNDNPGVNGSWATEEWWLAPAANAFWVPFELWNTGIGTPDDSDDDFRMVPFIVDDAGDAFQGDDIYALESWGTEANGCGDWEHSVSGGDNDPYTDWVYWYEPEDKSFGSAGYNAYEASAGTGTWDGTAVGDEVMGRTVLVSWNGGTEPPFTQDVPEEGTIFRLKTGKPNSPADTFTFVAQMPSLVQNEAELDNIRVVPNPFYMFGPYDPTVGSYEIKFHNLPDKCTITIYNLAGEFIVEIEKDDPATNFATWDAQTDNDLPVASGIYLWVVDAPGFGQKIGKMAVFTEVEVLKTY